VAGPQGHQAPGAEGNLSPMSQTVVPRKQAVRTSCGFCESTHGQPAGICHDADRRCKGTWPGFVPASLSNTTEGQTYAQVAQADLQQFLNSLPPSDS
jgi:hypothetical protein